MKNEVSVQIKQTDRKGERGAALVMVLMISFLLLVASAALLLEASMNTANVTDATSEEQAYYAAESGIQSSLNILRGNTTPNEAITSLNGSPASSSLADSGWNYLSPLSYIETTASAAATPSPTPNQTINFRKAATVATSNSSTDTSTEARLSRWLTYNANYPDRVTMGTGTYTPNNGMAYSVTVTDPDNTGTTISYTTDGKFYDPADSSWKTSISIGSAPKTASLVYTPYAGGSLNVSSGSAATNFGSFTLTPVGVPTIVLSQDLYFKIIVRMSAPFNVTKVMRGWIKAGTITSSSPLVFDYETSTYDISGSTITLNSDPLNVSLGSTTTVTGSMTQTEPTRLLVRSVGYGPRGARKTLETVVQKNYFNGLDAPATLTLIGSSNNFQFDAGNSQNVTYSGDDVVSTFIIPPVGTTNDSNLSIVRSQLCSTCKPNTVGIPDNISEEVPWWLQNTYNLDETLNNLKTVAKSSGRYFASGAPVPDIGNNATARGITYVDGDLTTATPGGGILVVRGNLNFKGGFDFKGLIIITGTSGFLRDGGGNGVLQGNIVIAPYNPANLAAGFGSPRYEIKGGGVSQTVYNSSSVDNGMLAVSNFVQGVVEK